MSTQLVRSLKTLVKSINAVVLLILLSNTSVFAETAASNNSAISVANLHQPEIGVYTSGQPSESDLAGFAEKGVKMVINLRPESEQEWDEKQKVEALGMQYVSLPIEGLAGVTPENAQKLESLLANVKGQDVLVHCASGNRVGALRALTVFKENGGQLDGAIQEGKDWGLTGLESAVRKKLSQ